MQFPPLVTSCKTIPRYHKDIHTDTHHQSYLYFPNLTCTHFCGCISSMQFYHMYTFVYGALQSRYRTIYLKNPSYFFFITTPPQPYPLLLVTTDLFYVAIVLLFQESSVNEIIQYATLGTEFFLCHSLLIHPCRCLYQSFFHLIAEQFFMVWMYHSQFNHSPVKDICADFSLQLS